VGNAGQSGSATQTTGNGSDATREAVESFFDPQSIADKPELQSAYKQMQASYTKRMQEFAKHRNKVDAYDSFERDPLGTMKQLAAQYGYQFVARADDAPKDWNPQSWDDVMGEAEKRVLKKMEPVFGELKNLRKQGIESYLDTHFSDWRTYEDQMMDKLRAHPSLVADPDALYRLAVPSEVWEARAAKAAMAKLKSATDNSQVSGGSTTARATTSTPAGPLSFNDAVEMARKRLSSQGIKRPAG
jgi:hypothetical protein